LIRNLAATLVVAALSAGLLRVVADESRLGKPNASFTTPIELSVATFNLRFASDKGPNSWPRRRPVMRECLRQCSPDIVGTQEGVQTQLNDIAGDLPEYAWVGTGRDGGDQGEFMAIFYRRNRFTVLATNHFWLSDTPEIMASSSWGNSCRRMVTWLKLLDHRTGREFYFWNTHLDHEVHEARVNSAELIAQRMALLTPKLPLILTGDFNCPSKKSRPYEILTVDGGLADTWSIAKSRIHEDYNSFQGFKAPQRKGVRIDWILARGDVEVEQTEIVIFSKDGQFPSDHFPVVANLRLR